MPGDQPHVGVELVARQPADVPDNDTRRLAPLEELEYSEHPLPAGDGVARHPEIIVDDEDPVGREAEPLGDLPEPVLLLGGQDMIPDLPGEL